VTTIDVNILTVDGTCTAALCVPDSGGPSPAVIMYPDAGGLRDSFRDMGERLSTVGYVVLVPDIYYRTPFVPFSMETVFTDDSERKRLFALMGTITPQKVGRDTAVFLDFLQARPEVHGTKVGTTGYCMGGRLSLIMAAEHADRIGAAASFHGGRLAVDDDLESPHHLANKVRARVYIGGAANDSSFTEEHHQALAAAYTAAGVDFTIENYAALHGYAVADNPTFDASASERHWAAMESLYRSALDG
jgi:carboxymethylenebutenolidase